MSNMGKFKTGVNHPNWKGDDVGNLALHEWVRRYLPRPKQCKCKIRPTREVSCNGKYNRDLENWEWLCRSCHLKKDGRDHKGEKNGAAKFTRADILKIRKEYDGKWGSFAKLGKKYKVAGWTISQIIKGKTWKT